VADQRRTALEHTARLADWAGAYATSDPDGALVLRPLPVGPAELALRYGREVAALEVRAVQPAPDRALSGVGPAGNVGAPNAHLQTTSVVPDSVPEPGPRTIRQPAQALRTPSSVTDATVATATRNPDARVTATAWLQPEIRPGVMVEIADAPQPDSVGPWFVTGVVHEIGPGPRGVTHFQGESLADGVGLLGQILGAIGGLL
jgi:hypothetical protein